MHRTVTPITLFCAACLAPGQPADPPPKFAAADVHVSPPLRNPVLRPGAVRAGRYQIANATMLDLVQTAYGTARERIAGGPSWLELDRYDVIAKVPAGTTPDALKLMLQALLADRFQLVVHPDTRPMPAYALLAGKKPLLKEAAASDDSGCRVDAGSGPVAGGAAIKIGGAVAAGMGLGSSNGDAVTLYLGPGGTVQFHCRNVTMAAFADSLHGMMGWSNLGTNHPVVDQTGLKGAWSFDVRWSILSNPGAGEERTTVFDALDKQLGLKLEQHELPAPVLLVDSVNRKPADNPPGTAAELPPSTAPAAFEVASVKPLGPPGPETRRLNRLQAQPGGRFTAQNVTLRFLITLAFDLSGADELAELPAWTASEQYDITAKAPADAPSGPIDLTFWGPMLRALLADRFKLAYHTEDRPVMAYALVAAKPKVKKADPAARTSCKSGPAPSGMPPGTRQLLCQNMTMAQFADRLTGMTPELTWPVLDATRIEGAWDFNLVFTQNAGMGGPGRGADGTPAASDPSGVPGLFDALEKQLGLKLEKQKRQAPVLVIDHLEQKPTDN